MGLYRAILYRLMLAVITLWLLSVIVFAGCQILPEDGAPDIPW